MKVAIVYASTTGNTEQLANAAREAAGADAYFSTADSADSAEVLGADLILLGSPAMGAEQLENSSARLKASLQERRSLCSALTTGAEASSLRTGQTA